MSNLLRWIRHRIHRYRMERDPIYRWECNVRDYQEAWERNVKDYQEALKMDEEFPNG